MARKVFLRARIVPDEALSEKEVVRAPIRLLIYSHNLRGVESLLGARAHSRREFLLEVLLSQDVYSLHYVGNKLFSWVVCPDQLKL